VVQPVHREVHFWSEALSEPPCGTLEDRFDWSDAIEDVTCDGCLEALTGDSGDLASRDEGSPAQPSAP
jgi:hypothetical protein